MLGVDGVFLAQNFVVEEPRRLDPFEKTNDCTVSVGPVGDEQIGVLGRMQKAVWR